MCWKLYEKTHWSISINNVRVGSTLCSFISSLNITEKKSQHAWSRVRGKLTIINNWSICLLNKTCPPRKLSYLSVKLLWWSGGTNLPVERETLIPERTRCPVPPEGWQEEAEKHWGSSQPQPQAPKNWVFTLEWKDCALSYTMLPTMLWKAHLLRLLWPSMECPWYKTHCHTKRLKTQFANPE